MSDVEPHLAMIMISSNCRINFAVSLLLTKSFASTLDSTASTDKLCSTRSNRRIFDVGAEGSKATGRTLATEAGEGASRAPSEFCAGPPTLRYLKTTAEP